MCGNDVRCRCRYWTSVAFERLSFFSLFFMGALTKRPLFILFCQQPKRRGECPPNAIIQSTPPQRYTCFPLSKTDIPISIFLSFFFSFIPFPLRSIAKPSLSRHERFHATNSIVPSSRIFVPFPIVGSPRDPVPVARISSIKRATSSTSRRRFAAWKNTSSLPTGMKRMRARDSEDPI